MFYFFVLVFAILLQSFSAECAVSSRQRRDNPADKAQEMAKMALDAAKQGLSAQHGQSITLFGQKFGVDHQVGVGAGDSGDKASSASSEKKNRRKRNTSLHFDKLFAFEPLKQGVKAHNAGSAGHPNNRPKRQAPENEGNVSEDSASSVQEKANDFLQKIREAWANMVKSVGQWMDGVAERIKGLSS